MKKFFFALIVLLPLAGFCQGGLLGKLKQKVRDRAEQRADEGMDKALDKAEEGVKKEGTASKQKEEKSEGRTAAGEPKPATTTASFESYSHYDFIPGENIVYTEDFSQDVIGEFPLKWATSSRGETVTIKGRENKWLRMFQNGLFLSPYIKSLPENFTAEFDLVLNYTDQDLSYVFPELDLYLLNSVAGDEKGRNFFNSQSGLSAMKIAIGPAAEANSSIYLRSEKAGTETFSNSPKPLTRLGENYGQPVHFAIWVQKERFRLWMNGEKIYDVPQAVPENAAFNRIGLGVASSNYNEENVGYYITNIKFAQGSPDMRSKLIAEGKLVTTGILFDVNSDKIKPESFGVLQEIAKVLKENAAVNVKIVGHTDNDGDDAKNLDLSRRRAASVKQALATQFGIDASRMQTDGKGEAQPVSDNNTKEGKAKNRRVEFIKQ
ncbi:OmpA family protein [Flavisolibacter ginsenosidimutans]|nr:OmpA family protein [Flavisolibacter ginsenosidimutans]